MKHFLAITALGMALSSSAAYANHIDFLDDGAFSVTDQDGGGETSQTVTGIDAGSTLGGQRNVFVLVNGDASDTATATLGPTFVPGADNDALTYTTSAGGSLSLSYGALIPGGADLNANFLDIPDMAADWDRIRLDFGPGSSAAGDVSVALFSRDTSSILGFTKEFAGGDANLDFLHTDFGPNATPEFFRNIDGASFTVTAPGAGSYVIESFNRNGFVPENATDVPAPGGLGLLALGLGLLGFSAFRRRAQG